MTTRLCRRRGPDCIRGSANAAAAMLAERARWPHALLLTGRAASASARWRSSSRAALLCESPRADGGACGECPSCRYVAAGQHPDLRIVEPVGVDDDGVAKPVEWITVDRDPRADRLGAAHESSRVWRR